MKKFDLEKDENVPYIHSHQQLSLYMKNMYVIDDYMEDYETYKKFMHRIMNLLRGSYTIRRCREYPVKFKFNKNDKETHTLQLRHFAINLIVWYPFVELHGLDVLNKDFILDCDKSIPKIDDYINYKLITVLRDYHIKTTRVNKCISNVLYYLRKISIDFSVIMGLNFSAVTFLDLYEKNPRIKEIMESHFDTSMQPHEIEQKLNNLQEELIDILKKTPDCPIGVPLRANQGIKHKQLREFVVAQGCKPTLQGETIPEPIENSTLLRGLDRPSYLYIDATGSRKSLVMNKKVMGRAGYFGKLCLLLARTLSMSTEVSDCGSTHLVCYDIKSKAYLNKLNGKYYKENEDDPDLKILDANKDLHLIGKKIYVRSAVTCTLGDMVCPKCVGATAVTNFDIADGVSAFESEEVTKVINQSVLSAKHLLTTDSEVITFNPEFDSFFTMMGGEINPIVNDNKVVENIEDYAIYIPDEEIMHSDDYDSNSLYNTFVKKFYVKNMNDENEEPILMAPKEEKDIYITDTAMELRKKGKGYIYFKDVDDDVKLFEMIIMNKELTKPLYDLMDLLNKEKGDEYVTIDEISQKFLDLLIESNIKANVIAAELIINRLVRSVARPYERPDFSKKKIEPYTVLTVSKALKNNKSPLIGLSFQNLKSQLLSDDLYEDRNGTSFIDPFYWTQIPTDNLKKYDYLSRRVEKDDDEI